MKVYDYIIVFKNQSYRLVDGISQLMLLLALIVFASSIPFATLRSLHKESIELLVVIAGIIG